jgi:ABC-type transporter Mla MlaB component
VIHFIRGGSIFRLNAKIIPTGDQSVTIFLRGSIVFSSWIPLQKQIQRFFKDGKRVTLDITETKLVDRRIMSKVDEWAKKFKESGLDLSVRARTKSIDE